MGQLEPPAILQTLLLCTKGSILLGWSQQYNHARGNQIGQLPSDAQETLRELLTATGLGVRTPEVLGRSGGSCLSFLTC